MEIEYNNTNIKCFGALEEGDTFIFEGNLYLKIADAIIDHKGINIIRFKDMHYDHLPSFTDVEKVKTKIVMER